MRPFHLIKTEWQSHRNGTRLLVPPGGNIPELSGGRGCPKGKTKSISSVLCLVVSDSVQPPGLKPTRLLCPWDSPGKSTGVGCHALLQGIFPIWGSNPGLLHCRQSLYHLSHQGSPTHSYAYDKKCFNGENTGHHPSPDKRAAHCWALADSVTLSVCLLLFFWHGHLHTAIYLRGITSKDPANK